MRVQRWGDALAQQPGWNALDQAGLEALIEQLNRRGFPANLNLQQRLDRLVAGLGPICWRRWRSRHRYGTVRPGGFALYASEPVNGWMKILAAWWRSYANVCEVPNVPPVIPALMPWRCSV